MTEEPIRETASAKINLTLRVLGRRPDGYHAIESLVVFAGCGDQLTLSPDHAPALAVTGPFATDIVGANLVGTTMARLAEAVPEFRLGAVMLEKHLPVAAGLGGGSADAAALLRAARRADPQRAAAVDWQAIARGLGADVPVCLRGLPALIWGIGERMVSVPAMPRTWVVLANPRVPLMAADVYRRLCAAPVLSEPSAPEPPAALPSVQELVAHLVAGENDLELPAMALCPRIVDVKAALSAQRGALLVRMSGSGPTCFAVFAARSDAEKAAAAIARSEPGWWVVATALQC